MWMANSVFFEGRLDRVDIDEKLAIISHYRQVGHKTYLKTPVRVLVPGPAMLDRLDTEIRTGRVLRVLGELMHDSAGLTIVATNITTASEHLTEAILEALR